MLTYSDVETFVKAGLTNKGYGTAGHPAMPLFDPGPVTLQALYKKVPGAMAFLQVGNGIGLNYEGLYDRPFVTVRVLGKQNDFASAETLAHDIDSLLLAVESEAVGSSRTLYVTRNAPPQLVDFDNANRYHFQTTYIAEAMR